MPFCNRMNDHLAPAVDCLVQGLQDTARGPRRNGLFALWLFVRMCDGMLPSRGLSDRSHRRRLDALKRRLSSLSLQPPLRRALTASLRDLDEGTPDAAALVLRQLVAPVREALGAEFANSVSWAALAAKELTKLEPVEHP